MLRILALLGGILWPYFKNLSFFVSPSLQSLHSHSNPFFLSELGIDAHCAWVVCTFTDGAAWVLASLETIEAALVTRDVLAWFICHLWLTHTYNTFLAIVPTRVKWYDFCATFSCPNPCSVFVCRWGFQLTHSVFKYLKQNYRCPSR